MKKKIIIGIIVVLLIASLIIIAVKYGKEDSYSSGNITTNGDSYEITSSDEDINITKGGKYTISGSINGMIKVNTTSDVTLVLDNANITNNKGPAIYIANVDNAFIELIGESTISATTSESLDAAIYSKDDLTISGEGSLTITSNYDGITSKDDLVLSSGTYTINASTDGIKGKDSVTINGGTYNITSQEDGIKTTNEDEKGDIIINDGTFTINSVGDAIHSENDLLILNGTFNITSKDDAMHANGSLTIKDGSINISSSYEGIEGSNITINGGKINVIATDDGFNVAGGNDTNTGTMGKDSFENTTNGVLKITGGTINVNASGDGLDSNGSIEMSGGTVYVDGPTNNGNGSLDYNKTFNITGGTLIAVGSSGMAQNVSTSSTQNTILINLSNSYSGSLSFGDITYTPTKSYSSIVISSPNLKLNTNYNLIINSETIGTYTLTNTVTSSGSSNGMFGGDMGQGQMGGMRRGR